MCYLLFAEAALWIKKKEGAGGRKEGWFGSRKSKFLGVPESDSVVTGNRDEMGSETQAATHNKQSKKALGPVSRSGPS